MSMGLGTAMASDPANATLPGGIQMGQMGEGGGGNFYMGGDQGGQQDGQQPQDNRNPELVVVDQAKEKEKMQNRQYLEELIVGDRNRQWINPWEVGPTERPYRTRVSEIEEMENSEGMSKRRKMFIINA